MMATKVFDNFEIHETLSNFISCDPDLFATPEVFNPMHEQLKRGSAKSSTLKCLALIIATEKGNHLLDGSDFLMTLISLILKEKDKTMLTYATMALKNSMLNFESLSNDSVPWDKIIELIIHNSYSKHNKLLQSCSLQTLRVMSDKPTVKETLCKIYKIKIREISCLTEESAKLKDDLVQWLDYRNFNSNELSKYSKLFI